MRQLTTLDAVAMRLLRTGHCLSCGARAQPRTGRTDHSRSCSYLAVLAAKARAAL